jgi:uncharacterized RDD family membrane protein YckC
MEAREVDIAPLQKRVGAFVIDDILVSLFIFIIFYEQLAQIGSEVSTMSESSFLGIQSSMNAFLVANLLPIVLLKVLYHTFFIWQGGKTLGKYVMKIKVIDLERGEHPDFLKSLLRASVRIVSESFMYIGFIVALFLPLKQTMHDKLTNCVVVNG